ncbi:NADH-quinone oxidoreductase subunit M [Streptosporangium sp. NBC_01755]|uniref:complex I subunit 4 family protein n=1 Tax=unclassified Streptosporangium TaxID=2632669 RepID=UPI002DD9DD13|nr:MULTISPECIES: NADH-quinone oxidoreductase subunit M [unclassified Streptosporangium]WSA24756.1 NADH-quinone oxidoreductase subunit M [Streptosporangium sp. NBC_01810]WSC97165.1 NADH-quinone oxidoreductase subunit M [Streptosporangium sp. NBC_01755]
MSWLLIALLGVPLAGAGVLLVPSGADAAARERLLRVHGPAVSGVTFVLSVVLAATFDYGDAARVQFVTDLAWIPGLDLRFHLGVDGISLPLVVLTTLLTFLCFVYLCRGRADGPGQLLGPGRGGSRPRALVFTLLVLEVGMIGTFLALDLLLFFVFFEVVLIPMYFVIAIWGGRARRAAAIKFILYTLLGSVVLLLGLLIIWSQTGTLDMTALARARGTGMSRSVQIIAFLAVGIGFAVKTPMWPLHTWLPDAHTEAPTVGSVLLAGVLLKMGTYGFARIAIPVLPDGAVAMAPWLGAFAVIGIIYGSLACLAQRDLKRMIAYSSVGHMGFVLLGFATLTPVGINGALFGNIAHGLITALLFFVAGAIKERYGTCDMPTLGGGMLTRLPHLGSLLTFACVASLGLPGLAGFWGEMLALLGAFEPAAGLSGPLYLAFMALGGLGTVLTAAYFLLMLSRVTHGRSTETVHVPLLAGATAGALPATGPTGAEDDAVTTEASGESPALHRKDGSTAEVGGEKRAGHEDDALRSRGGGEEDLSGAAAPAGGGVAHPPGAASAGRPRMPDVMGYELAAWVPLIALILLFGLWPKALLLLTDPVVRTLVGAP